MCFFNCKCKRLKRLGENILKKKKKKKNRKKHKKEKYKNSKKNKKKRNTVYPAHEPPRIICAICSRRFVGWKSCISVVFCFSLSCYIVFMFLSVFVCFRLVFLSVCIYNRKNTYTNKKNRKKRKNITTLRITKKYKKIKKKSPSRTLRDTYVSRRFVGWKSCISVLFLFFF